VVSKGNGDGCLGMAIRVGEMKLIIGNPGDHRTLTYPTPNPFANWAFGQSGGLVEAGTDHCRAVDGHTQQFKGNGTWLFNLTSDLNEANNLAALPQYTELIQSMSDRLHLVGKTGPPPAYRFYPGAAQTAATAAVDAIATAIGALEPSDYMPVPPTPHGPPAPPDPEGKTIPAATCAEAGGILDKKGVACCPQSCGTIPQIPHLFLRLSNMLSD
jgi:hypothetical protein